MLWRGEWFLPQNCRVKADGESATECRLPGQRLTWKWNRHSGNGVARIHSDSCKHSAAPGSWKST